MTGKVLIERWLASQLSTLTYDGNAVKVYRHPAPASVSYPFITVALTSAVDLLHVGSPTDYERIQYTIRVWDTGTSTVRVNAIASQLHQLIKGVPPVNVVGGSIVSCERVGALAFDSYTERNGELFQVDGGVYRFLVVTNS